MKPKLVVQKHVGRWRNAGCLQVERTKYKDRIPALHLLLLPKLKTIMAGLDLFRDKSCQTQTGLTPKYACTELQSFALETA